MVIIEKTIGVPIIGGLQIQFGFGTRGWPSGSSRFWMTLCCLGHWSRDNPVSLQLRVLDQASGTWSRHMQELRHLQKVGWLPLCLSEPEFEQRLLSTILKLPLSGKDGIQTAIFSIV